MCQDTTPGPPFWGGGGEHCTLASMETMWSFHQVLLLRRRGMVAWRGFVSDTSPASRALSVV